jgi:hypothetical protein
VFLPRKNWPLVHFADVTSDAPPPNGARPDLTVDGTIEMERLENLLLANLPKGCVEWVGYEKLRLLKAAGAK